MKPIIKWVGGKTQILDEIFEKFPKVINNYHEIFLGGGSVLFRLLDRIKSGDTILNDNIYCYDKNKVLIGMFNNIKNHPDDLYKHIQNFLNTYSNIDENSPLSTKEINSLKTKEELVKEMQRRQLCLSEDIMEMKRLLISESEASKAAANAARSRRGRHLTPTSLENAIKSKESYYYWIRKMYNETSEDNLSSVQCSAMFIFLNKTCFRGVYRVGPNGFNVPYGNYKNLKSIISYEELTEMSNSIQRVRFMDSVFADVIPNKIESNDFVYLDPPYVPINEKSFVNYQSGGFNDSEHSSLFEKCHDLNKKGIKFVMSNSDTAFVNNEFKQYNITKILCRRAINSKKPDSTEYEVIIKNY